MVNFTVDPNKKFAKTLKELEKKSLDLTLPLNLITQSWYKTNNAIFALKGPGKYAPLSARYVRVKKKELGSAYPALLGKNQRIKNAITQPTNSNAINKILNKRTLELGVKKTGEFIYAAAHQYGNTSAGLPARPYLFAAAEPAAPVSDINRRVDIWIKLLEKHIIKTGKRYL